MPMSFTHNTQFVYVGHQLMAEQRVSLTPAQLTELLERLDIVMAEAERLRHQVSRQLAEQRRSQQRYQSPSPRPRRPKRKNR
jgi:hypothetical protein